MLHNKEAAARMKEALQAVLWLISWAGCIVLVIQGEILPASVLKSTLSLQRFIPVTRPAFRR